MTKIIDTVDQTTQNEVLLLRLSQTTLSHPFTPLA